MATLLKRMCLELGNESTPAKVIGVLNDILRCLRQQLHQMDSPVALYELFTQLLKLRQDSQTTTLIVIDGIEVIFSKRIILF